MSPVVIVVIGFLVGIAAGEIALARRKLQFAAATTVAVHAVVCTGTIFVAVRFGDVSPLPIVLFWGGALLSWLGVRSHIESSILLRMLYLIRNTPGVSRTALLDTYESEHGVEFRLRELEESGFISRESGHVEILERGRRATKIYDLVTLFWR